MKLTALSEQYPDPTFAIQLSKRTTAKKTAEIIKFWLKQCSHNHGICNSRYNSRAFPENRPTRLLDVSDLNSPRLDAGDGTDFQKTEFLTLSHCWGDGSIFKLQKHNLKHLRREIPVDRLSRTFKDAMAITNALGYRYLWIDSLCIIQDSAEDWAQEAGRMAQVYSNAVLNLAACGPSGAGCFETRNPLGYLACKVSGGECGLYTTPSLTLFPSHFPLFTRSWIAQELLLSRRNVDFGVGELHWECFDGVAVETWPKGVSVPDEKKGIGRPLYSVENKVSLGHLFEVLERLKNVQTYRGRDALVEFVRIWNQITEIYSKSKLSFSSDKLACLSGIVSVIAQRTSLEYIAGMWMSSLPVTLLWLRSRLNGSPMIQPRWRGAPSWSWASIEGAIWVTEDFDDLERNFRWNHSLLTGNSRFRAKVLSCQVKQFEDRPRVLGEVAEAKLHIIGLLRPIPKWVIDDGNGRGRCGTGICTTFHAVFRELKIPVDFYPDIEISDGISLSFFTLFRDSRKGWLEEEGLVLAPHLDGFIRVGMMSIRHPDDEEERLSTADLSWGGGRTEAIFIY